MAEDERADLACAAERLRPQVEQIDDSTESGIAIRKGKRFGERGFHASRPCGGVVVYDDPLAEVGARGRADAGAPTASGLLAPDFSMTAGCAVCGSNPQPQCRGVQVSVVARENSRKLLI